MGLLNAIVFPFKKVQYLVEAMFQTSCAEIKFLKIITGFSFNSSYCKFFLYTIKKQTKTHIFGYMAYSFIRTFVIKNIDFNLQIFV